MNQPLSILGTPYVMTVPFPWIAGRDLRRGTTTVRHPCGAWVEVSDVAIPWPGSWDVAWVDALAAISERRLAGLHVIEMEQIAPNEIRSTVRFPGQGGQP